MFTKQSLFSRIQGNMASELSDPRKTKNGRMKRVTFKSRLGPPFLSVSLADMSLIAAKRLFAMKMEI